MFVLLGGGAGATYAYVRACDNASVAYKRLRQAALCRHRYPAHACRSNFPVRSTQLEGEFLTTCRSQTLPVDTRYCEPITRSRGMCFAYKADSECPFALVGLWNRHGDGAWPSFWIGVLSLGAWRCGLYLRGHDGFIASLWSLDAGLAR